MKKIIAAIISVAVIFTVCFGLTAVAGSGLSGLSGPASATPGQKITLNLTVNDPDENYGVQCYLKYDSSVLTVNSVKTDLSGWEAELSGTKIIVYDNSYAKPISGSTVILKLSFTVAATATAGTETSVEINDIKMANTKNMLPNAKHDITVAAVQQPSTSSKAPTSSVAVSSKASSSPAQTASKPASSKAQNTTTSVASTTDTVKEESSVIPVTVVSEENTSSETVSVVSKQDAENEKSDKGTLKWVLVIVCIIVLGGAVTALVYIKKKKTDIL